MSYYTFIYGVSIILSLACGWLVFKQYKNLSGLFFFLFTFFTSAWFLFYFLFFSGIENVELLLFFSRLNFSNGVATTMSLALFIYFFDAKASKIWSRKILWIIVAYISVVILYTCTDLIISGLSYSLSQNTYREIPGKLYFLHILLHITAVSLFVWMSVIQLRRQVYLNKIRLKRILFSTFLLIMVGLILQLILPIFGIWILEKEIIFFFSFLVFYIFLTVRRYYFSSLGYGIGKMVAICASVAISVLVLNIFRYILTTHAAAEIIHSYWIIQDGYSIVNTLLGIMVFVGAYQLLHRIFLGETASLKLKNEMHRLEKKIIHLTRLYDLKNYLKTEMRRIFKTNFCELHIFLPSNIESEVQRYFKNNLTDNIFINDVVFMEENKNKFNKEQFLGELPEEAFLVLPVFDTDGETNIGIFIIGVKSFGDFYTIEEIVVLRDFISFLEIHLKYIKTYALFQELSENLDRKVDEKTMEYNDLLSRQKEFISIISHEIKAPIANAIFQIDSMVDDIQTGEFSKDWVTSEINTLNNQLIRTGELTSRLFSMQHFESRKVKLIREMVHIGEFLRSEVDVYARVNEDMEFSCDISDSVKFVFIDKIQFQQVISNLLQNAVKFSRNELGGKVYVSASIEDKILSVSIEDSGQGFQGVDMNKVFEQYSTGGGISVGLGLGLYLCKNIVELHGGVIRASISELLHGAKFSIQIPGV